MPQVFLNGGISWPCDLREAGQTGIFVLGDHSDLFPGQQGSIEVCWFVRCVCGCVWVVVVVGGLIHVKTAHLKHELVADALSYGVDGQDDSVLTGMAPTGGLLRQRQVGCDDRAMQTVPGINGRIQCFVTTAHKHTLLFCLETVVTGAVPRHRVLHQGHTGHRQCTSVRVPQASHACSAAAGAGL